jgi:AcrR family transcriptional regulator
MIRCVDRDGLAAVSMEGVAQEAGVARATLYRHFPGGRDQLIMESVTREVGTFWRELADHVRSLPDLESRLVAGLVEARRRITSDERLQRLLASDADDLLPAFAESESLVHAVLVGYLRGLLERESLRPGCDIDESSDYLARMFLSYLAVNGAWDLSDPLRVQHLIRTQFLGGILDRSAPTGL